MKFKLKQPLFNNVVVKIIKKDTKTGNLVVPDMNKDKSQIGKVIAVGPGFMTMNGVLITPSIKEGDIVVLPKLGFTILELNNEEYLIGKENDLLTILEEEK